MKYYPDASRSLTYPEVNSAIEEVFAEHGRGTVQMPPKIYITFPEGDFRTMPASIPAMNLAGVKIVNVHPGNPAHGLPTVMATIILIDPDTGVQTALIDATALTDMRTGAAGAVAAKYLAAKKPLTVGLVGSGRQAEAQLNAVAAECDVEEVIVWSRRRKNAERFAVAYPQLNTSPAGSIEEACNCDLLITTTPSREPLIRSEWIAAGTHINAIGADAPGKQELDPALLARARVFVDDYEQAIHSGEVNVPIRSGVYSADRIIGTLGEVVIGEKRRISADAVTIFDSTGLAVQDLAIARLVVEKMEGKEIEL
ncbi:ornithine cyclodeaminase family protein [Methanocalculus taiwanensis]|uniref:Alanine dehydrogenase n=1 Tax=Methanocalculus taiwanensis TaxID=106207 RepID=A0ABD4TK69_9EURY|nr:ornithine cyclodeaminase family protein [Methanocalculus taiwanensis]MCQ1537922.1 ornithine cyclodeaminase family protein [Methanocalculus taiwanensis]